MPRCAPSFLGLTLCLFVGCRNPEPSPLIVHGAASLTESLSAVRDAWTTAGGTELTLAFGPTPQLARQIESGAPADVFLSADEAWMDTLQNAGLLRPATRRDLLHNRLVVVVPRTATSFPTDLQGLDSPQIATLAIAGENVPAGRYADAVLERSGRASTLAPKLTRGDSVRTVLHWVAEGQADAAFVYATDALAEPRVQLAFEVPAELQPVIVYPIAVVRHTSAPAEAERFVEFCAGPVGQATFERFGFTVE